MTVAYGLWVCTLIFLGEEDSSEFLDEEEKDHVDLSVRADQSRTRLRFGTSTKCMKRWAGKGVSIIIYTGHDFVP